MAINVNKSAEEFKIKSYLGVTPVKVTMLNPTKAELDKANGRNNRETSYYTTNRTDEGVTIKQAQLTFMCKTVPTAGCTTELNIPVTFFLTDTPRISASGKYQVINAYGHTAWLFPDAIESGKAPENMSWYDMKGVRPALLGEENLVAFLKALFNVPNESYMVNGVRTKIEDPTTAEFMLDDIKSYFSGNIKELSEALKQVPDNKVKIIVGRKVTDDNKVYTAVFNRFFIKNNSYDYSYATKMVKDEQDRGAFANVTFMDEELLPIKEYVENAAPTTFTAPKVQLPVTPSSELSEEEWPF